MQTTTKTFKLARNKGNARIWIEGANLLNNGRSVGELFTYAIGETMHVTFAKTEEQRESDGLLAAAITSKHGRGKIAGTATRPIIDICNRKLSAFFGDATAYTVEFLPNGLTISKAVL